MKYYWRNQYHTHTITFICFVWVSWHLLVLCWSTVCFFESFFSDFGEKIYSAIVIYLHMKVVGFVVSGLSSEFIDFIFFFKPILIFQLRRIMSFWWQSFCWKMNPLCNSDLKHIRSNCLVSAVPKWLIDCPNFTFIQSMKLDCNYFWKKKVIKRYTTGTKLLFEVDKWMKMLLTWE